MSGGLFIRLLGLIELFCLYRFFQRADDDLTRALKPQAEPRPRR